MNLSVFVFEFSLQINAESICINIDVSNMLALLCASRHREAIRYMHFAKILPPHNRTQYLLECRTAIRTVGTGFVSIENDDEKNHVHCDIAPSFYPKRRGGLLFL